MAPGLGGTTIFRPVTAAKLQARPGFSAGLPCKNTVRPRVRCPMTRLR